MLEGNMQKVYLCRMCKGAKRKVEGAVKVTYGGASFLGTGWGSQDSADAATSSFLSSKLI